LRSTVNQDWTKGVRGKPQLQKKIADLEHGDVQLNAHISAYPTTYRPTAAEHTPPPTPPPASRLLNIPHRLPYHLLHSC
jgi:hypothetical protein